LYDKGGEIVGAIQSIRDITGLKHLEERFRTTGKELQQALEKLGERELIDRIIETSPAGILVVNNDFKITFANARAEQLLCLKFKDKNRRSAYKLPKWYYTDYQGNPVPDEELVYKQVISTGRQVLDAAHAIQWPDGKRTLLSINGAPLYDRTGRIEGAVLSIEDVTLRREAEERINIYQKQLRSLAAKLALVEERERRRIAGGIHDHIGQSLAVARLKLGALKKTALTGSALSILDDINALIEEAIKNTRSLTFELSPPILYDLGFVAAVEWLGEQLLEKNGIGFNLVNRLNSNSLGEELRIILFTTVRELFFNIVKHAGAKKVNILVQKLGDKIQVEVVDDGAGFDTTLTGLGYRKNEGFGLFSIHERLEHLGGRLEILSEPGHGTRVTIEAPLKNRD
jgi:signal transduction histidine kinase